MNRTACLRGADLGGPWGPGWGTAMGPRAEEGQEEWKASGCQ